MPNQVLRCDGASLVRCSADGIEVSDVCASGCNSDELRCADIVPSNGLASFLDMAANQQDLDLRESAKIDTDSGKVEIGGATVDVTSATVDQPGAPKIRVLIVGSLTANHVAVTGANALAIVSNGDININGVFEASAHDKIPGAGAFNESACQGAGAPFADGLTASGGAGGGGFGARGGAGGAGKNNSGEQPAGAGGGTAGTASLIPLRGGCSGGSLTAGAGGKGGGAIQLVSRTQIAIGDFGVVAANGAGIHQGPNESGGGGGSGGGVLLEAPAVEVRGFVVANGGAGGTIGGGEDGHLDASPAIGDGRFDDNSANATGGACGNGGARNLEAGNGETVDLGSSTRTAWGGHGGGAVGRIRINTAPDGLTHGNGFSPAPSTGMIATR